jgi:hypothetical protein
MCIPYCADRRLREELRRGDEWPPRPDRTNRDIAKLRAADVHLVSPTQDDRERAREEALDLANYLVEACSPGYGKPRGKPFIIDLDALEAAALTSRSTSPRLQARPSVRQVHHNPTRTITRV